MKTSKKYVRNVSESTEQRIDFCALFKTSVKSRDNFIIFLIKLVTEYYLISQYK